MVCAAYSASGGKRSGPRFSKFAKFQVRPTSGFRARWLIEQHERCQSYRVACGMKRKRSDSSVGPAEPQPLACPSVGVAERSFALSATDAALSKGNVPSPAEWNEAWAVLSEGISLRDESLLRRKMRKVLFQATFISLALDESKHRKIIRFRADVPRAQSSGSRWRHVGASGFSHSGASGLLDRSKEHAAGNTTL